MPNENNKQKYEKWQHQHKKVVKRKKNRLCQWKDQNPNGFQNWNEKYQARNPVPNLFVLFYLPLPQLKHTRDIQQKQQIYGNLIDAIVFSNVHLLKRCV